MGIAMHWEIDWGIKKGRYSVRVMPRDFVMGCYLGILMGRGLLRDSVKVMTTG